MLWLRLLELLRLLSLVLLSSRLLLLLTFTCLLGYRLYLRRRCNLTPQVQHCLLKIHCSHTSISAMRAKHTLQQLDSASVLLSYFEDTLSHRCHARLSPSQRCFAVSACLVNLLKNLGGERPSPARRWSVRLFVAACACLHATHRASHSGTAVFAI